MFGARAKLFASSFGLYIVCSIVATLLFRQFAPVEMLIEDRQSLWLLRPNYSGTPRVAGEEVPIMPVTIDAQGFRALGGSASKHEAGAQIIAVGDSFTFGWDVADNETYPAQLQQLLDESRPGGFQVINGGMPGCTSLQALQLLRRWLPGIKPSIIVLLLGRNDGRRGFISDHAAGALLRWKPPAFNYVFPFMLLHYQNVQRAAEQLGSAPVPRVSGEEFTKTLEEIVRIAAANGTKVILMQHWARGEEYQLESFAAAHGLRYVPTPGLLTREAKGKSLFIARHFHPNKEGYAVMARALAGIILEISPSDKPSP